MPMYSHYGGSGEVDFRRIGREMYGQLPRRQGRSRYLQGLYDDALADPTATAGRFGSFFQQAAEGYSAPALRDFQSTISGVQANAARRFGGNVSSEEGRLVRTTSDDFSRNLTEALARLAPQQAEMGLRYTGMLGDAASGASSEEDRLKQLILAALAGGRGNEIDWGKILGTGAGVVAAAL